MPRQARIDVAGQLYHVMSRGIERCSIFYDEADYIDFTERVRVWLRKSGGRCLAWCLMPNHFHLLLLRGDRPLSELMHHLMTGYAVNFNLKYHRAGHLFQNRYKAIICDLEEYLQELVPYIHLNPLRAKLVKDLAELENYKWCGHAAITGGVPDEIIDREALLEHFGDGVMAAVEKYRQIMAEKAAGGQVDLSGGGLIRSARGLNSVLNAFRARERILFDQRVLGGGDFVEVVLKAAETAASVPLKSREELLAEVEKCTGITTKNILRPQFARGPSRARAVYCYLCKEKGGATASDLMRELGISQSGVSKLISKGRRLVENGRIIMN